MLCSEQRAGAGHAGQRDHRCCLDDEAKVWIATSDDIPGLVVDTESWSAMVAEVPVVIDELLEVRGEQSRPRRLTFKAEQRLDLDAA